MGDGLEYGHEDETAHTEEEDIFLFSRRNEVAAGDDAVSFGQFACELPGHEEQRNDKGGHTRQEYIGHQGGGSHVAIDPKHDGGHVTDGRPSAAGIGCNDNHTGVNPAFVLVVDEFAQQHDHHDGGREVVEHGREEERDDAENPQQAAFFARGDAVGDDGEAPVHVDELDDGHGTDEEEERGGDVAHVLDDLHIKDELDALLGQRPFLQGGRGRSDEFFELFSADGGYDGFGSDGIKYPQEHAQEEGRCGLVDAQRVLERDRQVADDEQYGNSN